MEVKLRLDFLEHIFIYIYITEIDQNDEKSSP